MSSRQVVHIILSLPLYSSSRKTIFINTGPLEKQTCVLKRHVLLCHEKDDSENITCMSMVDKYISRPIELENICLAEYASSYSNMNAPIKKQNIHVSKYSFARMRKKTQKTISERK